MPLAKNPERSPRERASDLYRKASSGASGEELLFKSLEAKYVADWSPDARFLLYTVIRAKTGLDLFAVPMDGDRTPIPVVQSEFNDTAGVFSPDGRWIAYQSNESAPAQVFVQGFPKAAGRFQVSTNGGVRPNWRRDGREIYYLSPDRKMMAVEVKADGLAFETGRPRVLFQTRVAGAPPFVNTYDVTADGRRFLINLELETAATTSITVVMNWSAAR
ncbi:MAG: TolB family protein [Bryobacteraceae bacterium]